MTDREPVSEARHRDQHAASSSRLQQLAADEARQEIVDLFEGFGFDVSTRAGREEVRSVFTWAKLKMAIEVERNAQVRRGIIDQVFLLLRWGVAGALAGLGAYFGIRGTHP